MNYDKDLVVILAPTLRVVQWRKNTHADSIIESETPILYLRSFAEDSKTISAEKQMIAEVDGFCTSRFDWTWRNG